MFQLHKMYMMKILWLQYRYQLHNLYKPMPRHSSIFQLGILYMMWNLLYRYMYPHYKRYNFQHLLLLNTCQQDKLYKKMIPLQNTSLLHTLNKKKLLL